MSVVKAMIIELVKTESFPSVSRMTYQMPMFFTLERRTIQI